MNSLYPQLWVKWYTTVLLEGWLWHLIIHKDWYAIKQRNQPTQPTGGEKLSRSNIIIIIMIIIRIRPDISSSKIKVNSEVGDHSWGRLEGSFLIATIPRCRWGHYPIPWTALLYPWSVPSNGHCEAERYQVPFFESLVWLNLGLNSGLPDHWQTIYSLDQWPGVKK